MNAFLICTYSSRLKSIFAIPFFLLLSYTVLLSHQYSFLSKACLGRVSAIERSRTWALKPRGPAFEYWPPPLLAGGSSAGYPPCWSLNFLICEWGDTTMPALLCYWGFNESLARNRCIEWGNDPSAAPHLPYVPRENLRSVQNELASPQIVLCAKLPEHIENVPVPSAGDARTPFLELLSCVWISGPQAAPSFLCISDSRVGVGVLLCSRKWGTCCHITHPPHGATHCKGRSVSCITSKRHQL